LEPRREEARGDRTKFHFRAISSKSVGWEGRGVCMGKARNAYEILVRKLEEKGSLGITRCSEKYNINMALKRNKGVRFELDSSTLELKVHTAMNTGITVFCFLK
jgi:hypothetical protein